MKRIISLLLAVMLAACVLSLAACQKSGDDAENGFVDPVDAASIPEDLTPYSLNSDGRATSYYKNDYDSENRLVRNYTYDTLGKLLGSTGYEYDEYGNEIKVVMYNADDEVTSQILWEKTPEGLPTKRTDVNSRGEIISVIVTEYNENNYESAIYKYDGAETLSSYQTFEYDESDNMIRSTMYDGDGTVEYYTTYVSNGDGTFTAYKYDGDGNLISTN